MDKNKFKVSKSIYSNQSFEEDKEVQFDDEYNKKNSKQEKNKI